MPDIPGYHYDPVKKKFFKVQPNHLLPTGSEYTQEAIKDRERETKKRKRADARGRREVAQTVRRSRIYQHSLLGGLGLERETGRMGLSSREGARRRAETCVGLYERHSLLDLRCNNEWMRISTLARDLRTGLLFVGLVTNGASNLRSYTPLHPRKNLLEYSPQGYDCAMAEGEDEWPSQTVISPAGYLLVTNASPWGGEEVLRIAKCIDPTDTYLHYDGAELQYEEHHNASLTRCAAALPTPSIARFAIGSEKTFAVYTGGEWTPERRRIDRDIFSVEWETPVVCLAGLRNGSVVSFDLRKRGLTARASHAGAVRRMRKIDDWRIVVNSGLDIKDSLCMYDLRYCPSKNFFQSGANGKPESYMRFPEYEGNMHGVMDVCPELDLVATASNKRKIQLFSLTTGRSITSPRFTASSSPGPTTRDPEPRNESRRSRRRTGRICSNGQNPAEKQNTRALRPLTGFRYPEDIARICFQTVPMEHGGDGTPSMLVGAGPIVDEWRM